MSCTLFMRDAELTLCCCAGSEPVPQQLPMLQHLGSLQSMADVGLVFQFPERHFLGATVGQVSSTGKQPPHAQWLTWKALHRIGFDCWQDGVFGSSAPSNPQFAAQSQGGPPACIRVVLWKHLPAGLCLKMLFPKAPGLQGVSCICPLNHMGTQNAQQHAVTCLPAGAVIWLVGQLHGAAAAVCAHSQRAGSRRPEPHPPGNAAAGAVQQ